MTEELRRIVNEWREKGVQISDEEAMDLLAYCNRKMDVCQIKDRENYLPLLYAEEVKDYLFRQSINATTILRKMEAERCAAYV